MTLVHEIWNEKYRPKTIDDCILPIKMKTIFKAFVSDGNMPNLLLSGPAGLGKTTVAKAMLDEMGVDFLVINGSKDGNIDILRTLIQEYASKVSLFENKRKFILIDEADGLNPQSTQPALRNFMEEFAKNCGFILTCNYLSKILPPLQDRCSVIQFKDSYPQEERKELLKEAFSRLKTILDKEDVDYVPKAVLSHLNHYFPNLRKAINELQSFSKLGKIDEGILAGQGFSTFTELIKLMKVKDWSGVRKWVGENADVNMQAYIDFFGNNKTSPFKPETKPFAIVHLNEHDYKSAFVVNQEINIMAMLQMLMKDCEIE